MTAPPYWNPNALEVNAAEHCNLSCAGCSHLSPVMAKRNTEVDTVARDLTALAAAYRARRVKLLGGEPLLNRALPALAEAVRAAAICDEISVCTNGLLLHRMDPALWRLIDHLEISLYPDVAAGTIDLDGARRNAAAHGVTLEVNRYSRFRVPYAEDSALPPALVRRVYNGCQIIHHWRCHTVHDGMFYACPQALFLARRFGPGGAGARDAVAVHEPDLGQRLAAYLARRGPLKACQRCLGTAGKTLPHRQAGRRDWARDQRGAPGALVDQAWLSALEADITRDDSGAAPERVK
ncbi:MAG: 4Fe-4S cluster-binding domain-containing protein [Oceanicaulis sp.]|nr:4Fe-4S cluster-binding domain-containing protein [Oceanicaulis sp.]